MAVMPPASITTSAAFTACADVVPTEAMRSPSQMIASPLAPIARNDLTQIDDRDFHERIA